MRPTRICMSLLYYPSRARRSLVWVIAWQSFQLSCSNSPSLSWSKCCDWLMLRRELPTTTSRYTSQAFTCSCWMWLITLCHHVLVFFPVIFLASLFMQHMAGSSWAPFYLKTCDPLLLRCVCAARLLPALVFWLHMSQVSDCSAFTRVFDKNILTL